MNSRVLAALASLTASWMAVQAQSVAAQATDPSSSDAALTLSQAVAATLATHPVLLGGVARQRAAEEAYGVSGGTRFPSLNLLGTAAQFQEPMIVTPIHGFEPSLVPPFDETLFQARAVLGYTVYDGGARGARIEASASQVNAAQSDLRSARQELIGQVAQSYLGVLLARDQLEAHDQRIDALQAELERVQALLAVGRAPRVEVLRAEAALADARANRIRTVTMRRVTEGDLGRLMGLSPGSLVEREFQRVVLEQGGSLDARGLLSASLDSNPGVQRARDDLTAAEAAVGVAQGARRPSVDLQAAYVDQGSLAGHFTAEWNVGLGISMPVFDGGSLGHGVSRAEALREASRENVRLAEIGAAANVDRALAGLEETEARAVSLRTAVDRSEEVARIERLRLDTGTGLQADYLQAEATLLSLRAALSEAEHGAVLARIQLAKAVGELDESWLAENLGGGS
jgi:outer membrane protein